VIGVPTVREPDGLALSSRNVYLSATERAVATMIYRVLKGCAARIKSGEKVDRVLNVGRIEFDLAGFALDYLEARHAMTLAPITSSKDGPIRLLAAVRLGKTRLIDNIAVQSNPSSRNSRRMVSGIRAAPAAARDKSRGASFVPK